MNNGPSEAINYTKIGGQALIEGILMRGSRADAIAVRCSDGQISLKVQPRTGRFPLLGRIPLLRGIILLFSSMVTGINALNYSAQFYVQNEQEDGFERFVRKYFGKHADSVVFGVLIAVSIGLAFLLFGALPTLAVSLLRRFETPAVLLAATEGVLKFVLFIVYIALVSRDKDVRRVFKYHGAEHKVISNYESGLPLTVENARTFSTLHPRCGTSFIFFVLAISIALSAFISWGSVLERILYKLLLLPVVAGISYELIRLSYHPIMKPFRWPGMMLQKLTTREPDDDQLEVAIAAFENVLVYENDPGGAG